MAPCDYLSMSDLVGDSVRVFERREQLHVAEFARSPTPLIDAFPAVS